MPADGSPERYCSDACNPEAVKGDCREQRTWQAVFHRLQKAEGFIEQRGTSIVR